MARPRKVIPSYRLHKQSGQAVVTFPLPGGKRKDYLLGRHGSPESRAEYERLLAEFRTNWVVLASPTSQEPGSDTTVNELLLAFWKHAENHYRHPDGTHTEELNRFRVSLRPVRELYGHTPAKEFGPRALKAVREMMIASGLSRPTINARVRRIRHVFKWGVAEQLVPVAVHQALATVAGLQLGRCSAPEPEPIGPVDPAHVDATLPFLSVTVSTMVRVQLLTGMRPGEVCQLRPCDIDKSAAVWLFRPKQHKTAYRGRARVVAIGPQAQTLLSQFWIDDLTEYLFSPRKAVEAFREGRKANRKTPRFVSHMQRNAEKRVSDPQRTPGVRYTTGSYGHAIKRAVARAKKAGKVLDDWHPNQLRHTFATQTRKRYGLEGAQVALGHATADVTQIYAEYDMELAARVAAEIG